MLGLQSTHHRGIITCGQEILLDPTLRHDPPDDQSCDLLQEKNIVLPCYILGCEVQEVYMCLDLPSRNEDDMIYLHSYQINRLTYQDGFIAIGAFNTRAKPVMVI